jgi:D-alanyl-D-alanine carboxypeptidase (penicillin-binding protein 5/6)
MIAFLSAVLVLAGAPQVAPAAVAAPVPCASAILMDAQTGTILFEQDADLERAPASLAKMLTLLIVLEELESGLLGLDDVVVTSRNAATMGGSQVYLQEGEYQTVRSLLQALVIASANDAAVALAEHLAGSEDAFVERMNRRVEALGCQRTRFVNAHGLDLRRQEQAITSARDLALIARTLLRFPLTRELASTPRAPFRGGSFWLENTNHLLGRMDGLDGLKTGSTPRAGACLCATAERDGRRLVSVVLGASGVSRFGLTRRLLEAGFAAGAAADPATE